MSNINSKLEFPFTGELTSRTSSDIRNFDSNNNNHLGKENCQNSVDAKKYIALDLSELCVNIFRDNEKISVLKNQAGTINDFFERIKLESGSTKNEVVEGDFKFIKTYNEDEEKEQIVVQSNEPVLITFKSITIDSKDIPNLKEHINHIEEILKETKDSDEDKKEFYQSQLEVLNKDKINVLRISDKNTSGVTFDKSVDPHEIKDENWLAIIQHNSISNKPGTSKRGSEGKGKFVNFSASKLSTVFYHSKFSLNPKFSSKEKVDRIFGSRIIIDAVTRVNNSKKKNCGAQGYHCAEWKDDNDNIKAPFPIENNFPTWVEKDNSDLGFSNDETGLDIFIIGFDPDPDWEILTKKAIIEKFHLLIKKREFIVKINDLIIDSDSIDKDLNDKNFTDKYKELLDVKHLIQTLESKESEEIKVNGFEKSDFSIKILQNNNPEDETEDLYELNNQKIVAWYRDDMLITKYMPFRDEGVERKLNLQFTGKYIVNGGFCAIVRSDSANTNKLLTSFENAKHDDFVIRRPHRKKYGQKAKELRDKVKEEIVKVVGFDLDDKAKEHSITYLDKRFNPDIGSQSSGISINGEGILGETGKPKDPKKPKWKEISRTTNVQTGETTVVEEDVNELSKTFGKQRTRIIKPKANLNKSIEAFNRVQGSSNKLIFIYKSGENQRLNIGLQTDPGDGESEEIEIVSALNLKLKKPVKLSNGTFNFNFKKGQLERFEIEIKTVSGYDLSLIRLNSTSATASTSLSSTIPASAPASDQLSNKNNDEEILEDLK